jgi:glutathione synthase/RimK-type ligase-like ATP-grasp enzyme
MKSRLHKLFGNHIFIKPNSGNKSFTGFDCDINDIDFEVNSIKQLSNVFDDELCMVHEYKELGRTEWRCWVVGGDIITMAPYGWDDVGHASMVSEEVLYVATQCINDLKLVEDTFVVDLGFVDGYWAVIEINAMSTSGFYLGMDVDQLCTAITTLY